MVRGTLTQGRLKELLYYDPESGNFTWKSIRGNQLKVGDISGNVQVNGYRVISIQGERYRAHHLAFLYMKGFLPPDQVDHVDLNKDNNSWRNLRLATCGQNQNNTGVQRNNKLGLKNITKIPSGYRVRLSVGGRSKCLGIYKDLELAELVAFEARNKYHGAFARN